MENLPANQNSYSVSEISQIIKQEIETRFDHVRVRGELGRVSRPQSGHIYLDLKDEKAVLAGVIWRGSVSSLAIQPEAGLEVIARGRMTTFAGQSRYQMIIDMLEPAGLGALMALLEARKQKLLAEGLFAAEKKQSLPLLPRHIGVITSPTGAVIRDILHRISDRFPLPVTLWPVQVQGENSAAQIIAAIEGFNALPPEGEISAPDLIIIARGGGSVEDLWGFNDEGLVRAAAQSAIPIISAIGHETDSCLLDLAADLRAPTPTAAAELAVPVKGEILARLIEDQRRLFLSLERIIKLQRSHLQVSAHSLARGSDILSTPRQRLDMGMLRLQPALTKHVQQRRSQLQEFGARANPQLLRRILANARSRFEFFQQALEKSWPRCHQDRRERIDRAKQLLAALSYHNVVARGYAVVRAGQRIISDRSSISGARNLELEFRDGRLQVRIETARNARIIDKGEEGQKKSGAKGQDQGRLFE